MLIKKCVRFVHWSRHYASAYICMYISIQHKGSMLESLIKKYANKTYNKNKKGTRNVPYWSEINF